MKYTLHERQVVNHNINRFAVPGGWIYEYSRNEYSDGVATTASLCFVPDPTVEIEE